MDKYQAEGRVRAALHQFSWTENYRIAICMNLSMQIIVQVQKVKLNVAHIHQLLDYWGGAPCTMSCKPPADSPAILIDQGNLGLKWLVSPVSWLSHEGTKRAPAQLATQFSSTVVK